MLDYEVLEKAYREGGLYSLQLEVGDICYQGCIYCYMNALPQQNNTIEGEKIREILADAKELGITAIEWLGGEPLIRGDIFEHMAYARDLGLRNNIWTGGLPFKEREILRKAVEFAENGLISVHLSTVNKALYKRMHPCRPVQDLDDVLRGVEEILALGYPAEQMLNSVTYTGLQSAEDMIETIDFFEERYGIMTSLNVYHTYLRPGTDPGRLEEFIPDKRSVAKVVNRVAAQYGKRLIPMNCVNKQYCSATIAVLCDGNVTPCATIREDYGFNIHRKSLKQIARENMEFFTYKKLKEPENLPEGCAACALTDECWGCRSRDYATGRGIYGKDPRCFRTKM